MRRVAWLAALLLSFPHLAWARTARLEGDINQAHDPATSSSPDYFLTVAGVTYFTADDGVHGVELWRTHGTPESTQLVRDIFPGAESSAPSHLIEFAGRVYFSAADFEGGCGLWRSDGTAAGTELVFLFLPKGICGGPGLTDHGPQHFARFGDRLISHITDGTGLSFHPYPSSRSAEHCFSARTPVPSSGAAMAPPAARPRCARSSRARAAPSMRTTPHPTDVRSARRLRRCASRLPCAERLQTGPARFAQRLDARGWH